MATDYRTIPAILSSGSFSEPKYRDLQTMCDLLEHAYHLIDHPIFKKWAGEESIDPFSEAMEQNRFHIVHRTFVERTLAQGRGFEAGIYEKERFGLQGKGIELCIDNLYDIWTVANKIVYEPQTVPEGSGVEIRYFRLTKAGEVMASIQCLMGDVNELILVSQKAKLSNRLATVTEKDARVEYLLKVKAYFRHMKDQLDAKVYNGMMSTIEIELSFHKELQQYTDISEEVRSIIVHYLAEKNSRVSNTKLLGLLMNDELDGFCAGLSGLVLNLFSHHDVGGNEPEKVYHALFLGILNNFAGEYKLSSNKEAGFGRFDILLVPNHLDYNGVIIEVKRIKGESKANMEEIAAEALGQIVEKKYYTDLVNAGHKTLTLIAAVFKGKELLLKYRIQDIGLQQKKNNDD